MQVLIQKIIRNYIRNSSHAKEARTESKPSPQVLLWYKRGNQPTAENWPHCWCSHWSLSGELFIEEFKVREEETSQEFQREAISPKVVGSGTKCLKSSGRPKVPYISGSYDGGFSISKLTSSLHQCGQWKELSKQSKLSLANSSSVHYLEEKRQGKTNKTMPDLCWLNERERKSPNAMFEAGKPTYSLWLWGGCILQNKLWHVCLHVPNVAESHFSAITKRTWPQSQWEAIVHPERHRQGHKLQGTISSSLLHLWRPETQMLDWERDPKQDPQ